MAVHIALHETDAEFELKLLSMANKETLKPEFLAINPAGKVPVLVVDGKVLTEVAAILFYLARRFPEANLIPQGNPLGEAQIVSWLSFIASTVHPARRQGIEHAHKIFSLADQRLGANEWCAEEYSIADIHLFRLFWRYFNGLKPDPKDFPNLYPHYQRMMARPAVKKTIEIETDVGYELPD